MRRIVFVLLLAFSAAALADEDDGKRAVPDYDGRGAPPATVGDGLLWVPRVALFPLYLVSEYILRVPAGATVKYVETNDLPEKIHRFFFEHPAGLVPDGYIDLSFRPRVGVYFFWNKLFDERNEIRATALFWADFVDMALLDRITLGEVQLGGRIGFTDRSDTEFFGLGPDSSTKNQSRYQITRLETSGWVAWKFGKPSKLRLDGGFRAVSFGEGTCCGDPSVVATAATGAFPLPPGYSAGYSGPFGKLTLLLDSREVAPNAGVGLSVSSELASNVRDGSAWMRFGATLGGSIDLTGHQRVVSLSVNAQAAARLTGDEIPFTEQISLGGAQPLPGFGAGRLVDLSALSATAQYEWPIWAYAVGIVECGVGDVFGAHLDGLSADQLRMSTGIGIRSIGDADHRFELFVGVGTDTFGHGAGIDWVRVAVGGVAGF